MHHERTVRSLTHLEGSASTARVLNLHAIAKRMANDPEYQLRPLFRNEHLNGAIVLKHRLRRNEYEAFADYRLQATKIILPTDPHDLEAGARYFFVGQKDYARTLDTLLGPRSQSGDHDRRVLQILDESPTLDPFVVREQLKRHGLKPSLYYLQIGPADMRRMEAFVECEIGPLAALSAGRRDHSRDHAAKLARKLLSSAANDETEPLRLTLKLDAGHHREGIFCWKAFLYYKWCLHELGPHVEQVTQHIGRIKLRGPVTPTLRTDIETARLELARATLAALERVRATIAVYDTAYAQLVERHDPVAFRDFLLEAPALFLKLGEGLGGIQHVVSYWRYRFPSGGMMVVDPRELADILEDFQQGLRGFAPDPVNENSSQFPRAQLV